MLRVIFDFVWIAILASITMGLLSSVIPAIGQSGTFISTMSGALISGFLHGRRTGVMATNAFSWQVAAVATVVMLAMSAALIEGMRRAGGFADLGEISVGAYALGIGVVGVLTLLVVRVFFRMGTKQGAVKR